VLEKQKEGGTIYQGFIPDQLQVKCRVAGLYAGATVVKLCFDENCYTGLVKNNLVGGVGRMTVEKILLVGRNSTLWSGFAVNGLRVGYWNIDILPLIHELFNFQEPIRCNTIIKNSSGRLAKEPRHRGKVLQTKSLGVGLVPVGGFAAIHTTIQTY